MKNLDRITKSEFRKLPKKEQKRLNRLQRIPVSGPGFDFHGREYKRKRFRLSDLAE